MKLREFCDYNVDTQKIYILLCTEEHGTQIFVNQEGEVRTLSSSESPNNEDGSWDGWVYFGRCAGEIPSDWEIEEVYDGDDNFLGYRDGGDDDDPTLYDSKEECFLALVEKWGISAEDHDEILDKEIEDDE